MLCCCELPLSTVRFSVGWDLLCSRSPALAFSEAVTLKTPALWCFKLQTWELKSWSICTSEFKNRYYLWTNRVTGREAPVEAGWALTRLCRAVTVWPFFFPPENISLEGLHPGTEEAAYNPPFVGTSQNNSQQDMAHYIGSVILLSKRCLSWKRGWGNHS